MKKYLIIFILLIMVIIVGIKLYTRLDGKTIAFLEIL